MRTIKILWSMSEFDGLWKHQNNPACTKSVRLFRVLKMEEDNVVEVDQDALSCTVSTALDLEVRRIISAY